MAAQAITTRRVAPPLEHRILVTATLCLLAFGAVMVYSASSPSGVVNGHGYGTSEFFMYLLAGAVGLIAMRVCEHRGLSLLTAPVVRLGLLGRSCCSWPCWHPGSASTSTVRVAGSAPVRSSSSRPR